MTLKISYEAPVPYTLETRKLEAQVSIDAIDGLPKFARDLIREVDQMVSNRMKELGIEPPPAL